MLPYRIIKDKRVGTRKKVQKVYHFFQTPLNCTQKREEKGQSGKKLE
jgi:hypothetical protein